MDNESVAGGTAKQDWYLRQAARLLLPSLSVNVHHNLISKANTSWIQCRRDCGALFQSLERLLQHERLVHGVQLSDRTDFMSFGTYKLLRLLPPQVKLDRVVEGELTRKWILRRRREIPRNRNQDEFDSDTDAEVDEDDDCDEEFDPNKLRPTTTTEIESRTPEIPFQFKCKGCRGRFISRKALKGHMTRERCLDPNARPHACMYCERRFRVFNTMLDHARKKHQNELTSQPQEGQEAPTFKCTKCNLILPTLYRLRLHETQHGGPGGVKPFACTFAEKEGCLVRFSSQITLKNHVNNIHGEGGLKQRPNHNFYCDKCPQRYRTEERLKTHLKYCLMRMFEPVIDEGTTTVGVMMETAIENTSPECDSAGEDDPLNLDTQPTKPTIPDKAPSTSMAMTVEVTKLEDSIEVQMLEGVDVKVVPEQIDEVDIKEEGTMTITISTILASSPSIPASASANAKKGRKTPATPTKPNPKSNLHIEMPPVGCLACPACGKTCETRQRLRNHIIRHNERLDGPYVCEFPYCGKLCGSKWTLIQHRLVHTVETPYKCSHCGVGFKTLHGRKYHERKQHTGDLPFKCQYCDKRFAAGQHCKVHELRAHTREKNFACDHTGCGKTFIMKAHLVEHERSHTGEKPLKCTYCGRGFARSGSRREHHQRHELMIQKMREAGMRDDVTAAASKDQSCS